MNLFKRALINIVRKPASNAILLVLIFSLGTILLGAISVRNAIIATEESVMMRIPSVATLEFDHQAAYANLGDEVWQEQLSQPTVEEMFAVGNLPYVRAYDLILHPTFYSRNLLWSKIDIDEERLPLGENLSSISWAFQGARERGAEIEIFSGNGVSNPNITDIDAGLITLGDGRTFTQAELDNNAMVVVISQAFATTNDLFVGSVIEFENIAHDYYTMAREGTGVFELDRHDAQFILDSRLLELEVIGIFDVANEFVYEAHEGWRFSEALSGRVGLYNRIYMPIGVAEDMMNFVSDVLAYFEIELTGIGTNESQWLSSIYVLYDSRDLEAFSVAASALLPEFWETGDLLVAFAPIVSSMDTMLQVADLIQWVTIVATVFVLTLLIILFLRDRRHEIGIYMALGDKKFRVVVQILMEIGLVASVGLVVSIFAGNLLADAISRQMFEQQLTEQIQDAENVSELIPWELILFNPGMMSVEETLAMHDVSLGFDTMIIFVSVGVGVILISTIMPIWYVVKLEPKEILL